MNGKVTPNTRSATVWAAVLAAALLPSIAQALPIADSIVEDRRLHFHVLLELGLVNPREVSAEVREIFGPEIALLLATDKTVSVRRSLPDEAGRNDILVDIDQRRLLYFREGFVLEFPVATARPRIQKYGNYRVTLKRDQPTWIPTPNQRKLYRGLPGSVPPGPNNPLGSKALNLSSGNLRIHGTNRPDQIGLAVSDGCVRMFNEHIDALFALVDVGDRVQWAR